MAAPLYLLAMDGDCDLLEEALAAYAAMIEESATCKAVEGSIACPTVAVKLQDYVNMVDDYGRSALFYACSQNDIRMTALLLSEPYNANPNLIDGDGYFPLFIPCQNGFLEIVQLLILHGANVNQEAKQDEGDQEDPDHGHHDCKDHDHTHDHDHDESKGCVETPLIAAIIEERVDIVKLLLEHDANVNVTTETFWGPKTALQCAEQIVQNREIGDLLFRHGAMDNVTCNSATTANNVASRSFPWMQLTLT